MSWVSDTKTIISADELAKDVAGAEALLERHQEHKVWLSGSHSQSRITETRSVKCQCTIKPAIDNLYVIHL